MRNATPACGAAEACAEQKSTAFRKPAILKGPSTLAGKVAVAGPHKAAPLHDPDAKDALVLNDTQWRASSGSVVPVVVDPCAHTSEAAHLVLLDTAPQQCCQRKPHAWSPACQVYGACADQLPTQVLWWLMLLNL